MTVVKKPIKDNNVITWEMAAYDSTEELYADINTLNDKSILSLREEIDSYIDSKTYLDSDGLMKHAHKNRWAILSTNALRLAKNLDITYLLTSSEILNTVIKKQRDYGHKNISKFGITGLVIRVHDKVARVENLMKKENYINSVSDETMLDTLMDIIGYSIIAYMWLNNTFMYELGEKK
jgi:hypothetical protein